MSSRARLSQARSRARRDRLLEAAVELFAEGGSRAVTHRAVATKAGLPPTSTNYYFASSQELLTEALSHHLQTWTDAMSNSVENVDFKPPADRHELLKLITWTLTERSPDVSNVEMSIIFAAARDPELRELAAQAQKSITSMLNNILVRMKVDHADPLAFAITSFIAGVAFERQGRWKSDDEIAELLVYGIHHLLGAHLLGIDVLDEAVHSHIEGLNR